MIVDSMMDNMNARELVGYLEGCRGEFTPMEELLYLHLDSLLNGKEIPIRVSTAHEKTL